MYADIDGWEAGKHTQEVADMAFNFCVGELHFESLLIS